MSVNYLIGHNWKKTRQIYNSCKTLIREMSSYKITLNSELTSHGFIQWCEH